MINNSTKEEIWTWTFNLNPIINLKVAKISKNQIYVFNFDFGSIFH